MKHTPGPWTYNLATGVVRSVADEFPNCRQPVICDLRRWPHEDTTYIDPANARLIAAAPDLLAALKAIKERLEKSPTHVMYASEVFDSFYQSLINETIAKVEAA